MDCPRCQEKGIKAVIRLMFCRDPKIINLHCFRSDKDGKYLVDHEWHDQQANELIPEVWEKIGKRPVAGLTELPTLICSYEGKDESGKMIYKTIYCFNNHDC